MKKSPVCIKTPYAVGPDEEKTSTKCPITLCVSLYVSGFAKRKNTSVV